MELRMEIRKNPEGYSEGTYEYRITDDSEPSGMWFGGGYASEALAREAGKKKMRAIRDRN